MTGFSPLGTNLFGEPIEQATVGLRGEFTAPPFSVMNAAAGPWQERKRGWLSYGIRSEVGRDAVAFNISDWADDRGVTGAETGDTSIFDPVLTELCYRWFCPPGGTILDPFAGGSVRGIVASLLGYRYTGIELRAEQVDANREQAATITPDAPPTWVNDDSYTHLTAYPTLPGTGWDMLFTCPPYYDLEVYSDDPRDLSAQPFDSFADNYRAIIGAAVDHLNDDSFAVYVIGDVRDKAGNYRDLPGLTVDGFRAAGCHLYNRGVLATPAGTLPVRVGKQFRVSRKLGLQHQDVLVFVKGDGRRATDRINAAEAGS